MKTIALIGGGPAALFMYKRIVEAKLSEYHVHIFEQHDKLGAGFPYSRYGASYEHITNVSDKEIPEIKTHICDWISHVSEDLLKKFDMENIEFNEYKVLPRLLFGEYLSSQFELFLEQAKKTGIQTTVHLQAKVGDIIDSDREDLVKVIISDGKEFHFNKIVICTGHSFPKDKELNGWFDSPYPPNKLAKLINHEVAIRGASLTAIDAIRTMAHTNGNFAWDLDGSYKFTLNEESKGFKIVMHSIAGLLPAIRFHVEEGQADPSSLFTEKEMQDIMHANDGFIPLDYVFDLDFRAALAKKQPKLYEETKELSLEEFISFMMDKRTRMDPFELFRNEFNEAEQSIRNHESIVWKETLIELSYVINYSVKHFTAEDMLRYKNTLAPLIAVIIAFVPQSSAREILALHSEGLLEIVAVDRTSSVEPSVNGGCEYSYCNKEGNLIVKNYPIFVDALGQKPFFFNQLPFEGLTNGDVLSPASLPFFNSKIAEKEIRNNNKQVVSIAEGKYILQLPGVSINDNFQPISQLGIASHRLYIMAVPFIAGLNPDYSGLDFCEVASEKILEKIVNE